jgi:hypothetical protein
MKVIRKKCLSCTCGQPKEVAICEIYGCPLWTRRFGVSPETARKMGKKVDPPASDDQLSQKKPPLGAIF